MLSADLDCKIFLRYYVKKKNNNEFNIYFESRLARFANRLDEESKEDQDLLVD